MEIIFVIGGARSGKSSFALKTASEAEGQKAFIATAEALDDEMKDRIEKHRVERGNEWDTFEEPIRISEVLDGIRNSYRAIVVDCLTIWLSNLLVRTEISEPFKKATDEIIEEFIQVLKETTDGEEGAGPKSKIIIISNEVGTGIVPENKTARRFRDLAGKLNQRVAEIAGEVYLVTAGIPMKIK